MILTEGDSKQVACLAQMLPIRDALEVVSGKWKILILTSIMHGNRRFKEIERSIPSINPKVLAKELKGLETHQLVQRIVHDDYPVLIEYVATEYSHSLKKVMLELHAWGVNHHKQLFGK
ncbi:winged helix-turn-helix transcriptional regulator [Hymenobacter terrenus]|uniref:winged helix-turn-helix transcriptional regulator n=1 Tax=Hymenobacter terrenus TaxID=1629124 RepID=UPI000A84CCB7|nr:helix-turn-helix domain-containing protein [Hymenobacter terrenus]